MAKKRLQVGITGGIGSGKTTVCRLFEVLGIPVYYADERAKQLMVEDEALVRQIRDSFGDKAYTEEGQLNRAYLADIVFSNPEKLQQLNALVHPAVGRDSRRWHEEQTDAPYTLREAALIFESGSFRQLDKVITVTAPKELRIERVMRRDQVDREAVTARMENQLPEEEKVKRADYVIYNDGRRSLIHQVWAIHQWLCEEK